MASLHALHDQSNDDADVTGRPEPPPVLATSRFSDIVARHHIQQSGRDQSPLQA
jgi:hypothetical protein